MDRGPAPRTYRAYRDAIGDLENVLGRYCSYCERRLPISLAVEHMAPKSLHPDRELEWDNFLLGCVNCNSVKGNEDVPDDQILWPDRDNILLAMAYTRGGFVDVAEGISEEVERKSRRLLELVGLNRHPGNASTPKPSDRDKRWFDRDEAWALAERCRAKYDNAEDPQTVRGLIVELAKWSGFFSVWMTVFRGHPSVLRGIIEAFPGTSRSSFNGNGEPITRTGGIV